MEAAVSVGEYRDDELIEVLMLPVMVTDMDAGRRPRRARSFDQLAGRKLEYVRLGHATALSFDNGCQVLLETAAILDGPAGSIRIEPGEHSADALATLLGDVVHEARADDTGALAVTFRSGSRLCVSADRDVEAWAVAGPGGFLVVCLARGELAAWGDAS